MNDTKEPIQQRTIRGEATLLLAVLINSFGVVLMLYSGSGISAISSVPYAFSEVFPFLTLGTWTYIFQGLLVFQPAFYKYYTSMSYIVFSNCIPVFVRKILSLNVITASFFNSSSKEFTKKSASNRI